MTVAARQETKSSRARLSYYDRLECQPKPLALVADALLAAETCRWQQSRVWQFAQSAALPQSEFSGN